ncbi:uncharacterized protein PHACADRAFT_251172 [Phanerochaete carnosa HHB-10118-sp]|uniref:Uncharacterized protein n=1 Tax=Phanerochaete carnosa (strain HHB-10118-sp) TaxID=650164 RepID=K5V4G6_PHACS|nr:uncharacterized protein PHACADRAFT_251172 [Phanerochaete carnosa HHB-10118-sp]EKM57501.1 hypothetical protein PHACADRAFT_251172 [Phanerochaete carnosa HHB-10118-sp]
MTPPFIPPPLSEASTDGPQQDTPEVDLAPDTSFAPSANHPEPLSHAAEPTQPPSLTVQTAVGPSGSPLSSPSSQPSSDQSGSSGSGSDESSSNTSSVEIVNYDNVSEGWEADRRRGVPLTERIVHERRRLLVAESTTNLVSCHLTPSDHADTSHHADTASTHGLCTHCGSPKPSSVNGRQLAPSPDLTEYEPDGLTPPSSPKSKKGWRKLLQPIIAHDTKAVHGSDSPPSPMPKSPTTTGPLGLGFLQGAWSSTLTLASTNGSSPSKAADSSSPSSIKRRETSGVRRLFAKGKDRDWSPPAPPDADDEPWEVVNRASVLWAEEQEHKSGSRSISPVSEVSQEHGYVSPMSPSPRSTRRQALASPQTTPFLNRPIRHPAMNGSTLTLPMNHSVVSLQSSTAAGSGAGRPSPTSDLGAHDTQSQKKAKRPPPPPPPPRRKAMSTTMKASPSAVWLPLIDTQAAASVRSYAEVASPAQTLASPMTATTIVTPYEPRPYPSLPSLRPSSPDGAETTYSLPSPPPSAGLYGSFNVPMSVPVQDSDAVSIASSYAGMSSAPATRYNPAQTRVPPPVVTVTDSMSTISIESPSITPPRTPTTPTHPHHYPGRPLPQPPRSQPPHQPQPALPCRQPSPLRTTAAVASPVSPAVSPISEHSYFSDLDDLASRVIEGDHNGRNYEVGPSRSPAH